MNIATPSTISGITNEGRNRDVSMGEGPDRPNRALRDRAGLWYVNLHRIERRIKCRP
jgi:hypothetical protein